MASRGDWITRGNAWWTTHRGTHLGDLDGHLDVWVHEHVDGAHLVAVYAVKLSKRRRHILGEDRMSAQAALEGRVESVSPPALPRCRAAFARILRDRYLARLAARQRRLFDR